LKVTEDSLKRLIPIPATTTTLYDPYIILQTDFFSLFCACLSLLTFETKLNKKKTKQKICKEKETMLKKTKTKTKSKTKEIGTLASWIVERTTGQHFLGRN